MTESKKTILFNPVSVIHDRKVAVLEEALPDWNIRRIYNPLHPWYPKMNSREGDTVKFMNGRVPPEAFDGVQAVILFSAQTRIPHCSLIQEAALKSIPVIAIEETFQMMLEQGYGNEYLLPLDHFFVVSEYEKKRFAAVGVPLEIIRVTGCPFMRKPGGNGTKGSHKSEMRKMLGCAPGKRVATLCLSFLTRSGENTEVRKGLLSTISAGLPKDYELVVKPHPSENGPAFSSFVTRYAPRAKIADRFIPIDQILDMTDVLFNRGNSQVVLDALCKGVPVIAVPLGRVTIFEKMSMGQAIVNKGADVEACLEAVKKEGMHLYERLFSEHLSITPEGALHNVAKNIDEIARGRKLYNPPRRLAELSLAWAFIGYPHQALRTLSISAGISHDMPVIKNIARLIANKNDDTDLIALKRWCGSGTYREWIAQSLWIKGVFMRGKAVSNGVRDWLSGFPPVMCKELLFDYARMLNRCYIKSGLDAQSSSLSEKLSADFGAFSEIKRMREGSSGTGRLSDLFYRMNIAVKESAKNIAWESSSAGI